MSYNALDNPHNPEHEHAFFGRLREIRQRYHANAESVTYRSGEHGTANGIPWTTAPGYGASIYTNDDGDVVCTVGEIWTSQGYRAPYSLINQTRSWFNTREAARVWARKQATAHGYPIEDDRPAYDLFTI